MVKQFTREDVFDMHKQIISLLSDTNVYTNFIDHLYDSLQSNLHNLYSFSVTENRIQVAVNTTEFDITVNSVRSIFNMVVLDELCNHHIIPDKNTDVSALISEAIPIFLLDDHSMPVFQINLIN